MLVVIESPNKIKKLKGLLPAGARIVATVGHFKDLPEKDLGVDLEVKPDGKRTYAPTFEYAIDSRDGSERGKKIAADLKQLGRGDDVYIASDPDREGYAIGMHVYQEVKGLARKIYRMEIREITKKGVDEALKNVIPFEQTNQKLYYSFLGRRVGDRLVGYPGSDIARQFLRKKVEGRIVVGRVQSPAVYICEVREREIAAFKPTPFWNLVLTLEKAAVQFKATHQAGNFTEKAAADAILAKVQKVGFATVKKVETKETRQNPKAPFTTVDLQVASNTQLRISPERTMSVAQGLFEAGLISYHRTDSVRIADEVVSDIRTMVKSNLGPAYVPPSPVVHKSKNSQADAHEAIRPTHIHPVSEITQVVANADLDKKKGTPQEYEAVYRLICQRTIASQMAAAVYDSTTVDLECAAEPFRATGRVMKFDGFLAIYKEREEDEEDKDATQKLPHLAAGEQVKKLSEDLAEKSTKAPARYTEATLVKALEKYGIGRPSTYATIISKIKEYDYIEVKKGKIHVPAKGSTFCQFLEAELPWLIDLTLTKTMEDYLDHIEDGKPFPPAKDPATWVAFCAGVHKKLNYVEPKPRSADAPPKEDRAPSEGSLKFAQDISRKKNITLPPECLTSQAAVQAFLDAHTGDAGAKGAGKSPAKNDSAKPKKAGSQGKTGKPAGSSRKAA